MLAVLLILILTIFTIFFIPNWNQRKEEEEAEDDDNAPQVKKLWGVAQSAMRERKMVKAEKALLAILRFDEKNAAAYNRLGILYAKEKHYKEAVECFEIAQSLDNNPSTLHNVGLIYLETNKYEKAALAFAQAIEIEGDQPGRYIAYAKALEKLGERNKAIEALETAYSLSPNTVVLRHILEIYENADDQENAELTRQRIEKIQLAKAAAEAKNSRAVKRTVRRAAKTEAKAVRTQARAVRNQARIEAKTAKRNARVAAQAAKKTVQAKPARRATAAQQTNTAKNLPKKRKII